jgi:hypothetical protein
MARSSPLPPTVCDRVEALPADEPVFIFHPLLFEANCGRSAVVLVESMSATQVAELAERFRIRRAVIPATLPARTASACEPDDVARLLPGWTETSPEVWSAP